MADANYRPWPTPCGMESHEFRERAGMIVTLRLVHPAVLHRQRRGLRARRQPR
jgi:hypothetical protein